MTIINNGVVTAYGWCSRKAHLLNSTERPPSTPYVELLDRMKDRARAKIKTQHPEAMTGERFDPMMGLHVLVDTTLQSGDLEASCDLLTRLSDTLHTHLSIYEPTVVSGTYQITSDQKLELAFVGLVLGQIQHQRPATGTIVNASGQAHRIKLDKHYPEVEEIIKSLRGNALRPSTPLPPVFLIDHCDCCIFHTDCLETAEKEDHLSLLARMTPKVARAYQKKGLFTVNQLSYTFRPRRSRKRRPSAPVQFKFELQALAIRTGQIYVQHLPKLPKLPVELFLDIEGLPDQGFDYLVGLLICEGDKISYHCFWADRRENELQMWEQALTLIGTYPEAPIYHYGSYEPRAIERLIKVHQMDCTSPKTRLVNVNHLIYGKIYFPTRSNGLKDLARQLGFRWTSTEATGLQSLVWRQQWEDTHNDEVKQVLITYNSEDCQALRTLTEELRRIGDKPASQMNVEFTGAPNRKTTPMGDQIHRQLDAILKSAHADYNENKLSFRDVANDEQTPPRKTGGQPGHRSTYRRLPKPTRVVSLQPLETCLHCPGIAMKPSLSGHTFERTVIDLVFTKNGCRKTVTKYTGKTVYCSNCQRYDRHQSIDDTFEAGDRSRYGHALRSWIIFQRVILRLSYTLIIVAMEEQFNESMNVGTIIEIVKNFGSHYSKTEQLNIDRLLSSPFLHADETKINIQGTEQFVWVFTNGRQVVFKLTETREADFVHQFLKGYQGVLISDFYGGYDGVECRQQKCLVHLIRDLNNDLWSAPFDREFEEFVAEVKNLLSPILEAVRKYGMKARHLHKFEPQVDKFYAKNIDGKSTTNELVAQYLKRFQRYRQSLFLFLKVDGVSWHNNVAENAIRPLAVQRKISGFFFKSVAPHYLVLLGIAQTCKYADKSFLKFLLSGETDIDLFNPGRRRKAPNLGGVVEGISGAKGNST